MSNKLIDFITGLLFAVLTIAGIGLTGCRKQASDLTQYHSIGDTKSDTLRLFNLLPDSSSSTYQYNGYVLYVNDSIDKYVGRGLFLQFANYGTPPVLPVSSLGGKISIKLARYRYYLDTPPAVRPDTSRILCQTTLNLPAHSGAGNLVFYYDSTAGKPAIQYLPASTVDAGAPAPGTFKIRIVNFCYNLLDSYNGQPYAPNSQGPQFALQLQHADSSVITGSENVPFGTSGPYAQFDYGTYQFLVYNLTKNSYIENSGPLNDYFGTFNMSPNLVNSYNNSGGYYWNYVFPNIDLNYIGSANLPTLQHNNIGSYPFAAGGCYTIFVVGNMYVVALDRQYDIGGLDNFGKIQVVNTFPGLTDLQVTVSSSKGQTQVNSLPFGSYTTPMIVPAGNSTLTFSSHGQTLYSYPVQVPRLGNFTYYFSADLKNIPFVFPQNNFLSPLDYINGGINPSTYEICKASFLDLCPDAGNIYITVQSPISGNVEIRSGSAEAAYKGGLNLDIADGIQPPTQYNIRLSASRPDTLASQKVASLANPFPLIPAPGTYVLVAAGLLNATDPNSALRLIMVKLTNYIPKAQ